MKRIFDDKVKRMLSGLLPFAKDAFAVWTPEEFLDLPTEAQPIFHARPFDTDTIKYIQSAATSGIFGVEHARQAIQNAFPYWENLLRLPDLEEIAYGPEGFADLNDNLVWILYFKAREMTFGLSKEEREGFASQQGKKSEPLIKAAESADSIPA